MEGFFAKLIFFFIVVRFFALPSFAFDVFGFLRNRMFKLLGFFWTIRFFFGLTLLDIGFVEILKQQNFNALLLYKDGINTGGL